MTPHTVLRQWKGKACLIELDPSGASLWREPAEGRPSFVVFDPAAPVPMDGDLNIFTDERFSHLISHSARFMREGVMAGLEDRPDHLPGRFVVCKAIGLAVHLGASTITLKGTICVTERAKRNLATMVRPLKGRRVRVIEPEGKTGLFPCE